MVLYDNLEFKQRIFKADITPVASMKIINVLCFIARFRLMIINLLDIRFLNTLF